MTLEPQRAVEALDHPRASLVLKSTKEAGLEEGRQEECVSPHSSRFQQEKATGPSFSGTMTNLCPSGRHVIVSGEQRKEWSGVGPFKKKTRRSHLLGGLRFNSNHHHLGMSLAAKLVVCLKLPSLSLFLEKATHSFQPQAFRGRMTAWSARNDRFWRAPCEGGAFPVGESPTRQPLQPEATGATMEVTKWLKPLVKRVTNW